MYVFQLLASCLPTDRRVLAKMKELTLAGVRRVPDMQKMIRDFVCNDLFAGKPEPPRFDARFWPSEKAIRNSIYWCRRIKNRLVALQTSWLLILSVIVHVNQPLW